MWLQFQNLLNPLAHTPLGLSTAAALELYERATRRYAMPEFGIRATKIGTRTVQVIEETVWTSPFCRVVHFKRDICPSLAASQQRLLLVAPTSGHFATLLRGTVEAFLPNHDVYITD
jgi:poly(3-hydroxybutyrate) depolymerase